MPDLYDYSLATIFLVGRAAILVATELGRWLSVPQTGQIGDSISPSRAPSSGSWP